MLYGAIIFHKYGASGVRSSAYDSTSYPPARDVEYGKGGAKTASYP